jgi:arylsulfatase A-like enzyme/predicted Zn-dependent protease
MKKRLLFAAVAAAVLATAALLFLRPREVDFDRLRKGREPNVILITVDTLRADKIGCYGNTGIETPVIDSLAARGIRYERCFAETPLTLPSHTTILTGTSPVHHGVRDNGGFIVPSELTTMAETFRGAGYETAAFVAAYVLDSKWGLDQGFDTYFDNFDLSRFEKISLANVQRPADEVLDEALAWLEAKKGGKFFAWIHLYDPHTPYEPPEPFKAAYPGQPYLGEIAFVDSQLGRLREFLDESGLAENLFLVFAADHGESLGEHGEKTHGFFVYQAAIHVPLIIVTPFPELQGLASAEIVTLADIMPTVCEMAGLAVPERVQGESLVPSFSRGDGKEGRIAYSETYYPRYHFGWSELRAVQDGRYKLILAPVPELYDVVRDPNEDRNLVYIEKDVFKDLEARAEAFIERKGLDALEVDLGKVDEETRERLAALGYIGSFVDSARLPGDRLANPRDKIGIFNEISKAREIGLGGNFEEAIEILRAILAEDPAIADGHFALGNIYYKAKRFEEAIGAFTQSLELKPDDSFVVINISNCYLALGRPEEAERFVLDHIARGFEDSQLWFLLGNVSVQRNLPDAAVAYFEKCLKANPRSASAHNALAAVHMNRGDYASAEPHLDSALALMPHLTSLHYNIAQLREGQGRLREAAEAYRREIESSPGSYKSMYNLSRLYRLQGRTDEELHWLEMTRETNPDFPMSYFYIARIYLNRGERYEEAVELVKKGIDLKPEEKDLPLGYFLLADLYNRLGNEALSREYALKGQEIARTNASARNR